MRAGVSLFGFTLLAPRERPAVCQVLRAMAEATRTNQLQTSIVERDGPALALARLSDARAPRRGRPARDERWQVWLDGDLYEQSGPVEPFTRNDADGTDEPDRGASLLLSLCQRDASLSWLRSLDGEFRAVIWDQQSRRLHLVTDRTGLRSFYYCTIDSELCFAPCARPLALSLGSRLQVNLDSVQHLLEDGHLQGLESLFDGILLLPEGAHLTWDASRAHLQLQQHWQYSELQEGVYSGSRVGALERAAELLEGAVRRQISPSERVGVSLSGGLDSRALLASARTVHPKLATATAFRAGTADQVLAREVAERQNVPHYAVELTEASWFEGRRAAIWWTDGHLNPLHMLGLNSAMVGSRHFDVNLDGFLGDAIVGGSYLTGSVPVIQQVANRGRRFINEGRRLTEVAYGRSRIPFFDAQLLEFGMALPPAWRRDGNFYGRMLRCRYPALFGPLSHNGRPVPGAPWPRRGVELVRDLFTGRGITLQRRVGEYDRWLRSSAMRRVLTQTLDDEALLGLLPEGVVREGQRLLEVHLSGRGRCAEQLGRYLALSTCVLQLLDSKARPEPIALAPTP